MQLSPDQRRILLALRSGWRLRAQRDLEGRKEFQLYPPDGPGQAVSWPAAMSLAEDGLIDSNKKFPTATFWLTPRGQAVAEALSASAPTG